MGRGKKQIKINRVTSSAKHNEIRHHLRHAYLVTKRINEALSAYKNAKAISEAVSDAEGLFRSRRDIAHYLIKYGDPGGRVWVTNPEATDDPNPYMPPPFGWSSKDKCIARMATGPESVWTELQGIADDLLDDKMEENHLEAEIPGVCAVLVAAKYFGLIHRKTAHSVNRLGWAYVAKGHPKLAAKMFSRALDAYEKC